MPKLFDIAVVVTGTPGTMLSAANTGMPAVIARCTAGAIATASAGVTKRA